MAYFFYLLVAENPRFNRLVKHVIVLISSIKSHYQYLKRVFLIIFLNTAFVQFSSMPAPSSCAFKDIQHGALSDHTALLVKIIRVKAKHIFNVMKKWAINLDRNLKVKSLWREKFWILLFEVFLQWTKNVPGSSFFGKKVPDFSTLQPRECSALNAVRS